MDAGQIVQQKKIRMRKLWECFQRDELLTHAEEVHNNSHVMTYLCITCDEEFSNESAFKMHMARDHRI